MLPVAVDCPFLIATSVFSNVYFIHIPLSLHLDLYIIKILVFLIATAVNLFKNSLKILKGTVCTHRNTDCLLKNASTKQNKYVVNQNPEQFDV